MAINEIIRKEYYTELNIGFGNIEIQNDGSQLRFHNTIQDDEMYIDTNITNLKKLVIALNQVIEKYENK